MRVKHMARKRKTYDVVTRMQVAYHVGQRVRDVTRSMVGEIVQLTTCYACLRRERYVDNGRTEPELWQVDYDAIRPLLSGVRFA